MSIASLLLVVGLGTAASPAESWQFVYVARSTRLEIAEGEAALTRSGATLAGPLRDDRTGEYRIELAIDGADVTGWFGAVESDDGGTRLEGSLHQWRAPGGECWLTIQLTDGSSSISLARNVPQCEEAPDAVSRAGFERSRWSRDFTDRSPATDACPGGTVSALRNRLAIDGPFGKEVLREHLPDLAPEHLEPDDEIYSFRYASDPDAAAGQWGFDGALVARGDCIVYVGKLGYDN